MIDFQSIQATLTELAEEHLARMRDVPWDSFAQGIKSRSPLPAGETFGCEIDGRYYDVGDNVAWLGEAGGDIELISFAETYFDATHQSSARVERSAVITMS